MDFTKLAFNPLSRSNEIVRYSSVHQENDESLAEHIAEVSTMAYLIAKDLQKYEVVDLGVLLEKCLLHDADEVLTGDIPRNTKYATTEAHTQLNKVAEEAIDIIDEMTDHVGIKEVWSTAKSGKEGLVLKIVDMLVVVKKAVTEIELRGNLSFLKVVTELESHLDKMVKFLLNYDHNFEGYFNDQRSLKYLRDLVSQARDEITTIRVKYSHIIQKYMIKENVIKGE